MSRNLFYYFKEEKQQQKKNEIKYSKENLSFKVDNK